MYLLQQALACNLKCLVEQHQCLGRHRIRQYPECRSQQLNCAHCRWAICLANCSMKRCLIQMDHGPGPSPLSGEQEFIADLCEFPMGPWHVSPFIAKCRDEWGTRPLNWLQKTSYAGTSLPLVELNRWYSTGILNRSLRTETYRRESAVGASSPTTMSLSASRIPGQYEYSRS